jgi:hypothetical protein
VKRIAAIALIALLSFTCSVPMYAGTNLSAQSRASQKQFKKQQKADRKQAKKQQKALKKYAKAQKKANKKALRKSAKNHM